MSKVQFTWLLIAAILTSCTGKHGSSSLKSPLFNFTKYFSDQATQLSATDATLIKTLIKEGRTETQELQLPDWNKELQPFLELDLNKPALKGSYKIDTLMVNPEHVRYTAIDSAVVIRNVDFYGTDSIVINKSINNMYYSSAEQLIYFGNGYSITAFIRPKAGKSLAFSLNASIKKYH